MRITKLVITKLHGRYNYNIKFNNDITFLYGKNGCGKTTILNIITNIITGNISRLFNYEFSKISLYYSSSELIENNTLEEKIELIQSNRCIQLLFNNKNEYIKDKTYNFEENDEITTSMQMSSLQEEIKEHFNILYLPLSRKSDVRLNKFSKVTYYEENIKRREHGYSSNYDTALLYVDRIVRQTYSDATDLITKLEQNLRDDIIYSIFSVDEGYSEVKKMPDKKLLENKISSLYKGKSKISLDDVYDKYSRNQEELERLLKKDMKISKDSFEDINRLTNGMAYFQSKAILFNSISKKFDEFNQKREKINSAITMYKKIINKFFENSSIRKTVDISSNGLEVFQEGCTKPINIGQLSSGEKQVIILFAYLIFVIGPKKQPIFIIDEPEISLHLLWQKEMVKSIIEATDDIQLVFATHSPEIVGKYRNKLFNIIPEVVMDLGEY